MPPSPTVRIKQGLQSMRAARKIAREGYTEEAIFDGLARFLETREANHKTRSTCCSTTRRFARVQPGHPK